MKILKENVFGKNSPIIKNYFKSRKIYKEENIFNEKIENDFEVFEESFTRIENYNFPEEYEFNIFASNGLINTVDIYTYIDNEMIYLYSIDLTEIKDQYDIEKIDLNLIKSIDKIDKLYFCRRYYKDINLKTNIKFYFTIPTDFIDFRHPELNQYVDRLETINKILGGKDGIDLTKDNNLDLLYEIIMKNKDIFGIIKGLNN